MHKFPKEVKLYHNDKDWFRKSGKRGYKDMLMQLTKENQAIRIQKYGEKAISAFPVGWTLFYQEPTPEFKFLSLNVFFAVEILVSKASQV